MCPVGAKGAKGAVNMRMKKIALVGAAAVLPLASVVLLEGSALGKSVTGTGMVMCHTSGTLNFNPPLTPNGTPAAKEVVTVMSSAQNCTGGSPTASPLATVTKPIKTKGTGKPKIAGSCKAAGSTSTTVKGKQTWNGAKPTKFILSNLKFGVDSSTGEVDETGTASTTGSYAGSGAVHIDFDSSSSSKLIACVGGSGSVSSATIDPANSTIGE